MAEVVAAALTEKESEDGSEVVVEGVGRGVERKGFGRREVAIFENGEVIRRFGMTVVGRENGGSRLGVG